MQHQVMGYDRSTLFSPDGRLLQVEYAQKTIKLGSASIGIACKDGVVIIADKRIKDKLIMPESATKIYEIDDHIMASAAGILSDARVLIEKAQLISQQHRVTYDSPIDVESVIKEIADAKQLYTQYGGTRPFGVSILLAGVSGKTPKVYVSDVTGNYFAYKATAIGENEEKIKELLRKKYKEELSVEEGIKLGLNIFKEILGKNFSLGRFDVGYINTDETKVNKLSNDGLKKYTK